MMSEYDQLIHECMDIHDDKTLDFITSISVNEAGKNAMLDSLAAKLYELIMDKVADIDYGSIPDSKGDITQIQNFDKLVESMDVIDKILSEYNQDKNPLVVVQTALDNTIARKDIYGKGFAFSVHLPIVMYNTIAMSIVSSIALLISSTVAFVGDAGNGTFQAKFDATAYNKSKDNVLFKDLARYNIVCANGDLDKSLDFCMQMAKKNLIGIDATLVVGAMAVVGLSLNIIPILRELVFFYYNTKQGLSDYFEIQSELIRVNSEYVKNNTISNRTDKERRDIAKRQAKVADAFNKLAIATRVDCQKASDKAKTEVKASDRKYKINDIMSDESIENIRNRNT